MKKTVACDVAVSVSEYTSFIWLDSCSNWDIYGKGEKHGESTSASYALLELIACTYWEFRKLRHASHTCSDGFIEVSS